MRHFFRLPFVLSVDFRVYFFLYRFLSFILLFGFVLFCFVFLESSMSPLSSFAVCYSWSVIIHIRHPLFVLLSFPFHSIRYNSFGWHSIRRSDIFTCLFFYWRALKLGRVVALARPNIANNNRLGEVMAWTVHEAVDAMSFFHSTIMFALCFDICMWHRTFLIFCTSAAQYGLVSFCHLCENSSRRHYSGIHQCIWV